MVKVGLLVTVFPFIVAVFGTAETSEADAEPNAKVVAPVALRKLPMANPLAV